MSMCSPIDGAIFNLQQRLRRAFGWLAAWAAAAVCLLQTLHYYRCVFINVYIYIMTVGNTF